jgi:hypothetical protein
MTSKVDARGLSCPQPVILTRRRDPTAGEFPIEVLGGHRDLARERAARSREGWAWRCDVEE